MGMPCNRVMDDSSSFILKFSFYFAFISFREHVNWLQSEHTLCAMDVGFKSNQNADGNMTRRSIAEMKAT